MLKPEEHVPMDLWTIVLSKLSTEDKLSCSCVCNSLKKEVDSILKENQDRLWLRQRDGDYRHYFCYDKDHKISPRDTLYFGKTISVQNLTFVSALMPSLKILQLDPLDQIYKENYDEHDNFFYDRYLPDYRDEKGIAVPITKIFPQVACLILPGTTEKKNFTGDLSQVKHVTLFDGVREESPTFPNLDSVEVRNYTSSLWDKVSLPMPSKRFVFPQGGIQRSNLPKTLEVIETKLNISGGKPHFENLKILKGVSVQSYGHNLETLMNFLKDHKGSLIELSFSGFKEVAAIKDLVPLLTQLQKLSVTITTDKQAIEFKESKALAPNLQYFELSYDFRWPINFASILENLPIDLDNLSIKLVWNYKVINIFMEKIMEKIVNGDTKTVTIGGVVDTEVMERIVKMKPEAVRIEEKNKSVHEVIGENCVSRTDGFTPIWDIVISL